MPYVLFLLFAVLLTGCRAGSDSQAEDPVAADYVVAYIERPRLASPQNGLALSEDRRLPGAFRPGARLMLKDSATPSAPATDITFRVFSSPEFLNDSGELLYDVRDLAVSWDGRRLLFALHAPPTDNDEMPEPTWNIWEYDLDEDALRRVISSDTEADAAHDVAPAWLADGSIVFSSTRQRESVAILLDEGKPQFPAQDEARRGPAFVLHVMNGAGENIRQITFNQSHDLDPLVLSDGSILFSRWDAAGQTANNGFNLYRVNPDGTGLALVFGRHSHTIEGNSLHFFYPREEDGRILVQARGLGTAIRPPVPAAVDITRFAEHARSLDGSEASGLEPMVPGVGLDGRLGLSGSYEFFQPLYDGTGRYLAGWSPCRALDGSADSPRIVNCTDERLADEGFEPALPLYGLWIRDPDTATQLPVVPVAEGQYVSEAVLMISRPLPDYRPPELRPTDLTAEAQELATEGFGIVHIRSVYDFDGADTTPDGLATMANPVLTPADQRPARFVRFEKPVSLPDQDVRMFDGAYFGVSQAQRMREILGYTPVEPDGSVRVAVPANVAFAVSVVDASGRRITERHQNWLQLRPGETLSCNGCHTAASTEPHGHYAFAQEPANAGAETTGLPFPGTSDELWADMGETMAETWARHREVRRLSTDPEFQDGWTDPEQGTPSPGLALRYSNLLTPVPVSDGCAESWSAICRTVIHYEQHIHPLWGRPRLLADGNGVLTDDYTCTSCHTTADSDGATRIPDAHLHLGNGTSADNARQLRAYRELLATRFEQEIVDGLLQDRLIDSGEVQRDDEGVPILDADGNEIPIMVRVPLPPVMSVNGALASTRFQAAFGPGGSHQGLLDDEELRLLNEWLDLGAQYYNNPFDTPEN